MILRTVRNQSPARRGAFTLLEVLIVVAIIVMLAGVGGYYMLQQFERAKDGRAKIEAKALADAVERYNVDHHAYPDNLAQLATPPEGRPYVPVEKLKDPWGKDYSYTRVPDGQGVERVKVFTTSPIGQELSNFSK